LGTAQDAGVDQSRDVDVLAGLELARVDRLLKRAHVDLVPVAAVPLAEAALRQTAMERHLTAFEAADRDARARRLSLAAASAGLADARPDATADAYARFPRAGVVLNLVEPHGTPSSFVRLSRETFISRRQLQPGCPYALPVSSTMRTRWGTFAIMPRTDGVSSRTRRRLSLFRPRPIRVWVWISGRRIALLYCSTVIV